MGIFQCGRTKNDSKQTTHITKYHVRCIIGEVQIKAKRIKNRVWLSVGMVKNKFMRQVAFALPLKVEKGDKGHGGPSQRSSKTKVIEVREYGT